MSEDIDQIYDNAFNYDESAEIQMEAPAESVPEQTTQNPNEPASAPITEYEYTALGKKIKEPLEMILKRASQGYDYAQKMQQFKQQQQEFEERYGTYKQIDDFAQKNPEWFAKVQELYHQRDQQATAPATASENNAEAQIPEFLKKEIDELKKFKDDIVKERQMELQRQEDAKLEEQIESVRKQFPDLDFRTPDENGLNLEYKVIKFANENRINDFNLAFKAFYHDELVKIAAEKAKESVAKEVQTRNKKGLLDTAPKELRPPSQTSGYEDVDSILSELGLST